MSRRPSATLGQRGPTSCREGRASGPQGGIWATSSPLRSLRRAGGPETVPLPAGRARGSAGKPAWARARPHRLHGLECPEAELAGSGLSLPPGLGRSRPPQPGLRRRARGTDGAGGAWPPAPRQGRAGRGRRRAGRKPASPNAAFPVIRRAARGSPRHSCSEYGRVNTASSALAVGVGRRRNQPEPDTALPRSPRPLESSFQQPQVRLRA